VNIDKENYQCHYDMFFKLLHWVLAILLIGMVSLGWFMMSIEDQPGSGWYFNLHKSLGLIAATLILLRILWRLTHKIAPLPGSIPKWQAKLARSIHFFLYCCMVAMPLTGFIGASYGGHGVAFFGWKLPDWASKNHDIAKQLFEIHGIIAWVLVVLIAFHVLAAFKHLIINKDGVFQRMWF
jgi:cytochrome b561